MLILATFSVLVLSFIFSMLGLGGALLYVPVFYWLGYDFKTVAIPTGLLLNGITALSAAIYYLRAKMVDIKGALPLLISSFLSAPIGAYLTEFIPVKLLMLFFIIAIWFAGLKMLFSSSKEQKKFYSYKLKLILMIIGGAFIGLIAGMLGIGGGFLFVPLMIAIGYETKIAAATNSFIVIFSSFSGFLGHITTGHFNVPLMIFTTVAVIIGSQIGARVMKEKMKSQWIKQMFGIILIGVGIKLLWKNLPYYLNIIKNLF